MYGESSKMDPSKLRSHTSSLLVRFPPGCEPNIDQLKIALANEGAIEVNGDNVCEGCLHCQYAGIRWPASPDCDSSRSWVERCDTCERFDTDLDAAIWVAMCERVGAGIAHLHDEDGEQGVILSPDGKPDRTRLKDAWRNAGPGTAVYIDHDARDDGT
jgi:hypothetical protein